MLLITTPTTNTLILGSANLTRRNIGGYNLESNVFLRGVGEFPAWQQASEYFDSLWNNEKGTFSASYEAYDDTSSFKKVIAWIMENIGLGTF
jgi:phosphatidylserine/phosphatidylglycerophosphate/cardiolipin synthase-like enzyme